MRIANDPSAYLARTALHSKRTIAPNTPAKTPAATVGGAPTAASAARDVAPTRTVRVPSAVLTTGVSADDAGAIAASSAPAAPSFTTVLGTWGNNGGPGDINGDGLVDGADLGLALAGATPEPQQTHFSGIEAAWGSDDPAYDFNADGIVDGADLGLLLGGLNTPSAPDEVTDDTSPDDKVDALSRRLADAVLAARDGDKDGIVNVKEVPQLGKLFDGEAAREGVTAEDLSTAVAKRLHEALEKDPAADVNALARDWYRALTTEPRGSASDLSRLRQARAGLGLDTAPGASPATQRTLDRIADDMQRSLAGNGFGTTPPANLPEVVHGLGLGTTASSYLMRRLAGQYSAGLGINAKA